MQMKTAIVQLTILHFITSVLQMYDRVLNLVNKIKAVSIISPSNEKGNLIAARISKNNDILYNSIETVNLTIDKHLMRKHLSLDLGFQPSKNIPNS